MSTKQTVRKPRYYIAYGSNLNIGQMQRRCPTAMPVGPMLLPDAQLVFRGVADVEHVKGAQAACGVWTIQPSDERALDQYEGVAGGLYFKETLRIRVTDDRGLVHDTDALIYLMSDDTYYARPSGYYVDVIRQGYNDFGLDRRFLNDALQAVERLDTKRPRWPLRSYAKS